MGYSFMSKADARRVRQQRMTAAKQKGRHTKAEWQAMKVFFKHTCVRCLGKSGLVNIEKYHIMPVYMGGSDGLENLQPLCARCNCSKSQETIDWRPHAAEYFGLELPKEYQKKG